MEAALEVDASLREDARLLGEVEFEAQTLHARGALLERHVALGHDGLLLQAAVHAPRREFDVLILDRDELARRRVRGEQVLVHERLLALRSVGLALVYDDADRSALFGQLELRVEPALLLETRRERIGVEGRLGEGAPGGQEPE